MADPYRKFKYEVEIGGFTRAGFSNIEGLNSTTDITEYREGGDSDTPRKLPGQTKFDNITMQRGKSSDNDFNSWREQIFQLDRSDNNTPPANGFRKRVVIYLKDKAGNRVKKWTVKKAWPAEYQSVDGLDANSSDTAIEQMVLAHEGWKEENLAINAGVFED